ncbi:unnamed protein product [Linum tenue]|uniref:AAA+ ATPase domain-containing protein n=1 Tax=Linum tenue TaxID=586396 RepID=A0AAV0RFM7_9ROSI|nr:unnamed protein product [Linum tenue]
MGERFRRHLATIVAVSTAVVATCEFYNKTVPQEIRSSIADRVHRYISPSDEFTFIVEDRWQRFKNSTFHAVGVYLPTKIGPSTSSLMVGHNDSNNILAPVEPAIAVGSTIVDEFQGRRFEWTLHEAAAENSGGGGYFNSRKNRWYQLKCKKEDVEFVTETYLPHVSRVADEIVKERDGLSIFTYSKGDGGWDATVFKHPSTFDTLAMDPALKQDLIDDLNLFVQRRDYFRSVGRAWKRGYLLYGPPGTGKSSLVAAIANHLKYNVYDLQLQSVKSDSDLRDVLTATTNRSILLLEDVDCSSKSTEIRLSKEEIDDQKIKIKHKKDEKSSIDGVTLSGLLNFIDGLWSTCGDERIIILTTNHKEKLDPALLRPGRMDVHIHMGYCSFEGFRLLADNYLGVKEHPSFKCVEDWMQRGIPVTPAEVAQQLMKSDDPQVSIDGLVEFFKNKKEAEPPPPTKTEQAEAGEVGKKCEAEAEAEEEEEDVTSSRSKLLKNILFFFFFFFLILFFLFLSLFFWGHPWFSSKVSNAGNVIISLLQRITTTTVEALNTENHYC